MELTRREFLKLSCMTAATLALGGCGLPVQQALVSQLDMPEYRLPGESRWFATTCGECSSGCGLSVRVADGRAKKLEGLTLHPVNHGKVCARGHSSLQALYNPDRIQGPMKQEGEQLSVVSGWDEAIKILSGQMEAGMKKPGSILLITESLHGSLGALIVSLAQRIGAKIWVLDFPGTYVERSVMKEITGKQVLPYFQLKDADYVVNFGSDFLGTGNSVVHDNWEYGEFRQGRGRKRGILVSFSPRMNMTVANSDRWVPVSPGWEGLVALGIGNLLMESGRKPKGGKVWPQWARSVTLDYISKGSGVPVDLIKRLAQKLILADYPFAVGGFENYACSNGLFSLWVIQMLNNLLTGSASYYEPDYLVSLPSASMDLKKVSQSIFLSTKDAVKELESGKFKTSWIINANPVYVLPKKLNVEALLRKVPARVVFAPYLNETTPLAEWVLATQSWLEEWGDSSLSGPYGQRDSNNGDIKNRVETIYGLRQPVVEARSGSMSVGDILLAAITKGSETLKKGFNWDSMQSLLKSRFSKEDWDVALSRAGVWNDYTADWELYGGVLPKFPPPTVSPKGKIPSGISPWEHIKGVKLTDIQEPHFNGNGFVLIPFLSHALHDGRVANRPWMQELPDPMTSVSWNSWIEMHTSVAEKLGIERGDVVKVTSPLGTIEVPSFPSPGIHPDAVAIPVGTGHFNYGQYANRGVNPLSFITPAWLGNTGELAWISTRVRLEKTLNKVTLITLDTRVNNLHREALPH